MNLQQMYEKVSDGSIVMQPGFAEAYSNDYDLPGAFPRERIPAVLLMDGDRCVAAQAVFPNGTTPFRRLSIGELVTTPEFRRVAADARKIVEGSEIEREWNAEKAFTSYHISPRPAAELIRDEGDLRFYATAGKMH